MTGIRHFEKFLLTYILCFVITLAQDPPKPKLPDVFQVQVQGIFQDESTEVDGSLFYDRPNNRAALTYTYQGDTTTSIYDFNNSQLIYIYGVDCSVTNITEESKTFFPFTIDKETNNLRIGSPEEVLFFTESKLDRQDIVIFPAYIYTATVNVSAYGLINCELTHVFSKPELEMADCESHSCRSTLVSISVSCPPLSDDMEEVNHIYNFYQFRSTIKDEKIFKPPVGVHCQVGGEKAFPDFPSYYSFSFDLIKEQKDLDTALGVYTTHKRIWYDTKLKLIRMDEFDKEGLLEASRIFDFYGQIAYTIIAGLPLCQPGDLQEDIDLDKMTLLPKIFFAKTPEEKKKAVYIGMRTIHGLEFEVWTISYTDEETEAKIVEEFYFTNNIQDGPQTNDSYSRISHVEIFTYQKDDITDKYKLSLLTYLSISNFRTKPEEWEAFDISSCFSGNQRLGFRLKVEGPQLVRNSYMYEEVLEKLYMKLIQHTNVSVIRISQLKGRFNGMSITEFTGWILKKVELEGSKVKSIEPSMVEAYNMIEKAAADGKLTIKVKKNDEEQIYKVTAVFELIQSVDSCVSGGTLSAVAIVLFFMGITIGLVGFYVFLKKRTPQSSDQVQLHNVAE